jgi:hypothetical protein
VSFGVLNLTHRNSHAAPEPLVPGQRVSVRLQLNEAGHRFAAGHRLRVALSSAYWPMVWPAPEAGTLELDPGRSRLELPVRASGIELRVPFGPAESTPAPRRRVVRTGDIYRTISVDAASEIQRIEQRRDDGRSVLEDIGVETEFIKTLRYRIHPVDPTSARAEAEYDLVHRHPHGWDTRIKSRSAVACTATHYIVESDVSAFDGEVRIFARSWTERIARDLG